MLCDILIGRNNIIFREVERYDVKVLEVARFNASFGTSAAQLFIIMSVVLFFWIEILFL